MQRDPDMISKLGSGFGHSREEETFLVRNEGLHVPQCGFIASSEALFMKTALGDDKNVVRQGPRNAMHGPKLVNPWDKHKSGPCHAQRATLGDTAKMAVGFAKSASHTVVIDDGCVKTLVSSNNLRGGIHQPKEGQAASQMGPGRNI